MANPIYRQLAFTQAFDRQENLTSLPNWRYLTGTLPQLKQVWQRYSVAAEITPAGGMIGHSDVTYVIDAAGRTRRELNFDEELQAIQRDESVRHPFLLSMERVEVIDGELVIVMELADHSLQDLLHEQRGAGRNGIERGELLAYLGEAANVLDYMNVRHGLQHLDVKPGNLFVVADHVKVADFGLVRSLADHNGSLSLGGITPLYAAPEVFQNKLTPSCDQYSLAVVYIELLTGKLPFDGKNSRQLMVQHTTAMPNLEGLPASDQAIIARALAKDPAQRFRQLHRADQRPAVRRRLDWWRSTAPAAQRPTLVRPEARRDTIRLGPRAETRTNLPRVQTPPIRPALGKYLPDLQFRCCVGRAPATESWEAQSADGRRWLVRFLYGVVGHDPCASRRR